MIRIAITSDIPQLLRIEREAFEQQFHCRQFYYLINHGKGIFIVDEIEEDISGYAYITFQGNASHARLYSIAVSKDYLHQGIATKLIHFLEKRIQKFKKGITLETQHTNEKAIKFYKKEGYTKIETIKDYYHKGSHAIKFKKDF